MEIYYENENVKLYKGDCLQIMPLLEQRFDAVITDPPYGTIKNMGFKWDQQIPVNEMWQCLNDLKKDKHCPILLFGQQPFCSQIRMSNIKDYRYDLIWKKNKCNDFLNCNVKPLKYHQNIMVFYTKKPTYNTQVIYGTTYTRKFKNSETWYINNDGEKVLMNSKVADIVNRNFRFPGTVLDFPFGNHNRLHKCQKPVPLLEWLIKSYSNEGDFILDFTAGSGSLGEACMNTNRRCVLIEKEEKYCEIIKTRLMNNKQRRLII